MGSAPAPPPQAKKSNVVLWILVGVGGFFLLLVVIAIAGIAYFARNPALVMTKMINAANPNVDVVSVNDGSKRITLRDKHTGKTYDISFDDARNGKFTVKEDGQATLTVGGAAKVPAWVPDYPGSDPQGAFSARGRDGDSGTFTFKTSDSSDKVSKFYQDQFQSSGLKLTTNVSHQGDQSSGAMLVAEDDAKQHTITVILGVEGANTTVAVTYVTSR